MTRVHRLQILGATLAASLTLGGCGGTDAGMTAGPHTRTTTSAQESPPGPSAATSTRRLDSIVVLGHSGTTGYNSDPSRPGADIRENSWATGTNPKVDSIYRRLLRTHPALKGHTTSLGVDGSTVDDLAPQVEQMTALDPAPDVVIIQTIDNDIRCDGTDTTNEKAFGSTLDGVLSAIETRDPGAQVFLVSQWASVQTYVDAVKEQPSAVMEASGNGPCDTFTFGGRVRPAGIASLQRLVDAYWTVVQRVCDHHPRCWTDHAALQRMPVTLGDLTDDLDHLSVNGHAVMARYAWDALPAAIKNRP